MDWDPYEDTGTPLKSEKDFQSGLMRVQNLASWVALGGTAPEPGHPAWQPSWAVMCKGASG